MTVSSGTRIFAFTGSGGTGQIVDTDFGAELSSHVQVWEGTTLKAETVDYTVTRIGFGEPFDTIRVTTVTAFSGSCLVIRNTPRTQPDEFPVGNAIQSLSNAADRVTRQAQESFTVGLNVWDAAGRKIKSVAMPAADKDAANLIYAQAAVTQGTGAVPPPTASDNGKTLQAKSVALQSVGWDAGNFCPTSISGTKYLASQHDNGEAGSQPYAWTAFDDDLPTVNFSSTKWLQLDSGGRRYNWSELDEMPVVGNAVPDSVLIRKPDASDPLTEWQLQSDVPQGPEGSLRYMLTVLDGAVVYRAMAWGQFLLAQGESPDPCDGAGVTYPGVPCYNITHHGGAGYTMWSQNPGYVDSGCGIPTDQVQPHMHHQLFITVSHGLNLPVDALHTFVWGKGYPTHLAGTDLETPASVGVQSLGPSSMRLCITRHLSVGSTPSNTLRGPWGWMVFSSEYPTRSTGVHCPAV